MQLDYVSLSSYAVVSLISLSWLLWEYFSQIIIKTVLSLSTVVLYKMKAKIKTILSVIPLHLSGMINCNFSVSVYM